jgi:hypothetical protein
MISPKFLPHSIKSQFIDQKKIPRKSFPDYLSPDRCGVRRPINFQTTGNQTWLTFFNSPNFKLDSLHRRIQNHRKNLNLIV